MVPPGRARQGLNNVEPVGALCCESFDVGAKREERVKGDAENFWIPVQRQDVAVYGHLRVCVHLPSPGGEKCNGGFCRGYGEFVIVGPSGHWVQCLGQASSQGLNIQRDVRM